MIFKYNITPHTTGKQRMKVVEFTPYSNLLYGENIEWEVSDNAVILDDRFHPILLGSDGSKLIKVKEGYEEVSLKMEVEVETGKTYLFTNYVRNNDALSTGLYINGEYKDSSLDTYTQRVLGVFTATEDTAEIELRLYDNEAIGYEQSRAAWVDGAMLVEIQETSTSKQTLLEKYPYVENSKDSPTVNELLGSMFHFSPNKFYLVANGRRIEQGDMPLSDLGIDETTPLSTGIQSVDKQIFNAMVTDVPLMSMLEGKRSHVSPAYPKEDREMSRMHESHFPRVQFFTGFAVNTGIADTVPNAEEVNYALNIYIPITKVLSSVTATMMLDQSAAIMAELGWAKVRGSDYFLKNEQLYVLQTQYIQDLSKAKKRT